MLCSDTCTDKGPLARAEGSTYQTWLPVSNLTVFTGCMFAGKSEALILALQREMAEGRKVLAVKPSLDNRYSESEVVSHSGYRIPALNLDIQAPFECPPDIEVVGVDEVQFFGPLMVEAITRLLQRGVKVLVSGLDLTAKGEPFGVMPQLLCLADTVTKLRATCARCGGSASRSQRTIVSTETVVVGGTSAYEPRCVRCFTPHP